MEILKWIVYSSLRNSAMFGDEDDELYERVQDDDTHIAKTIVAVWLGGYFLVHFLVWYLTK